MRKKLKQFGTFLVALSLVFSAGCSSSQDTTNDTNNANTPSNRDTKAQTEPSDSRGASSTPNSETTLPVTDKEKKLDHENDTLIGLKNIKIDTKDRELSESEKAVITYFDNDYLLVTNYDFLRRYPNIFQDTQISVKGEVKKVVSMDNENYSIILWLGIPWVDDNGEYVLLNGKTNPSAWLVEGDQILVNGRYTGIETISVDGTSYTIPVINVFNTYYAVGRNQFIMAEKFDAPFIKKVANVIFGDDIEIRNPVAGEDLSMDSAMVQYYALGGSPQTGMDPSEITEFKDLVVELEDQSNTNFTKFRFSKYDGSIIDAKGPFDAGIIRKIEFSADFEHFFLFTHNEDLETLKLSYYDKSFHKIWSRDFDEISNAVYDYTEANLYIVVNNELHIINLETGEDIFDPSYVGEKKEIRKDSDGIVIVSPKKSDGIMKISVDGDLIWKANLSTDVDHVDGLQFVNGNIVLNYVDENWTSYYCLVDSNTGEMIVEARE